jgi:hypothetical protein
VFGSLSGLQFAHAYADFNAHVSVHGVDQYSDAILSVLEDIHTVVLATSIQYEVLSRADEPIVAIEPRTESAKLPERLLPSWLLLILLLLPKIPPPPPL